MTYWVITVKDPGDPETGVLPYERRFAFDDVEEAYRCAQGAKVVGFDISVAKVLTSRERSTSTLVA
jgi:hypothetical protein